MLFSHIDNWRMEEAIYPEAFKKALAFLETQDIANLDAGKYAIDGENIFALVQDKQTDDIFNRAPEAHVKYIDIQFMYKGSERIGFIRKHDGLVVKDNRLEEKDMITYENEVGDESFVILNAGDFAIFFPEDIHRPLCFQGEKMTVRKVVLKIAVTAL